MSVLEPWILESVTCIVAVIKAFESTLGNFSKNQIES